MNPVENGLKEMDQCSECGKINNQNDRDKNAFRRDIKPSSGFENNYFLLKSGHVHFLQGYRRRRSLPIKCW